jgi:hypothetical protein
LGTDVSALSTNIVLYTNVFDTILDNLCED